MPERRETGLRRKGHSVTLELREGTRDALPAGQRGGFEHSLRSYTRLAVQPLCALFLGSRLLHRTHLQTLWSLGIYSTGLVWWSTSWVLRFRHELGYGHRPGVGATGPVAPTRCHSRNRFMFLGVVGAHGLAPLRPWYRATTRGCPCAFAPAVGARHAVPLPLRRL